MLDDKSRYADIWNVAAPLLAFALVWARARFFVKILGEGGALACGLACMGIACLGLTLTAWEPRWAASMPLSLFGLGLGLASGRFRLAGLVRPRSWYMHPMEQTKRCDNLSCVCEIPISLATCSERCARAEHGEGVTLRCECGHDTCAQEMERELTGTMGAAAAP